MPAVPRYVSPTISLGNCCPRDALASAVKSRNLKLSDKRKTGVLQFDPFISRHAIFLSAL